MTVTVLNPTRKHDEQSQVGNYSYAVINYSKYLRKITALSTREERYFQ